MKKSNFFLKFRVISKCPYRLPQKAGYSIAKDKLKYLKIKNLLNI